MHIPRLETERLWLREPRLEDMDDYARIGADPEVMRYIDGRPRDRAATWRSLAVILGHWWMHGFGLWAVEEKSSGSFLGRVGLHQPEGWPGMEVGWMIDRERWGEGFATEAGRVSMEYAFEELKADQVISVIHPDNTGSIQVAKKLGERHCGEYTLAGQELLLYGIDRNEYEALAKR